MATPNYQKCFIAYIFVISNMLGNHQTRDTNYLTIITQPSFYNYCNHRNSLIIHTKRNKNGSWILHLLCAQNTGDKSLFIIFFSMYLIHKIEKQ